MAIDFNAEPYYDDFEETKKFYRILFKPGYAVQARELTQLQTQLQDQIAKFGKHVFTEGTVVLNGGRAIEKDLLSIKLDPTYLSAPIRMEDFLGYVITGQSSQTKAFVKLAEPSTSTDPYTLIVKIISGVEFIAGEVVEVDANGVTNYATIQAADPFNSCLIFSMDAGVFFVKGSFVYNEAQTIAVDKYSNTPSKNIGFVAEESLVTYTEDETLMDNAQGTYNYAAPGADRYKINLNLISKDISDSVDGFIEIARVDNGELVINLDKTIYSEIGKELARRTYDESGNYTVKPWKVQVLEHQDSIPNVDKFTIALEPGKGYVKGYEFETINQTYISLDRARTVEQADNLDINVSFGNYVIVSSVVGSINPNSFETVTLKDVSSATIGTARVRFFQYLTGTIGSSAKYKMYLFNIVMNSGKYFQNVTSVITASFSCSIDSLSKYNGSGDTFLSGNDSPGLVFPISNSYIKTIRDSLGDSQTDYQSQRVYTDITFDGSGQATIATANGNERFVGSGTLSDDVKDNNYHIVVTNVGSSSFTLGQVIRFNTASSRSIVLSTPTSGATQNATFSVGASVGFTATIIAGVNENGQGEKVKDLSSWSKKVITNNLNQTIGGLDSIGVSDIYDVSGVYNIGSVTDVSGVIVDSTGNVTNWNGISHSSNIIGNYSIDTGQRAEIYDHGNLVLVGDAPVTPTDNLLVIYRNFTHTGTGFFSVDSYAIAYEDIPSFSDKSTGITYNLRDCIDFRPRRIDNSSSFSNNLIPNPIGTFNADYQYYLGRMDKIIAMPNKSFQVVQGIPAVYPAVPGDYTDGMTIYAIIVPPYTSDLTQVGIKYVDNKRYTMRDIGKLDKRIQNLEYYTQLSLLEKQAKDTSIPDSSNFEKFKNGFAVDPFTSADIFVAGSNSWAKRRWTWWSSWFNNSNSWNSFGANNYNKNSIADAYNQDFNAAIDPMQQELRAPFTVEFNEFNEPTLNNGAKGNNQVTLEYTELSVIKQLYATQTINVNPFNIITFNGSLTLDPAFDQWVDTNVLPVINRIVDIYVPDAADLENRVVVPGGNGGRGRWATTKTTSTSVTNVIGSSVESLGATVTDIQFVPYIRENTIVGVAKGVKPNAELHAFVEETNVDAHCRPLTLVTVSSISGTFNTTPGEQEELTFNSATGKAAYYSSPSLANSSERRLAIMDQTGTISVGDTVIGSNGGSATVTAVETYNLDDALVPDEYGVIAFEFQIPAATFKTGERTLRLIDVLSNDILESSSTAEAKYTATGMIQDVQETLLTTRAVQRQKVTTIEGYWYDPLAQTFNVDPRAFPQGMHVSSVDVYFKTKSNTVPITMQIRRTVNGYPSSYNDIPFAEVTLMPDQVSYSSDASSPTTFTFSSPIYLSPNDYAITLISQCDEYNVWISETGKISINSETLVDKQPYNGSLFKSQNAATWTAVQEQDLMFNIKRAVFNTSGSAEFEIKDPNSIINYSTLFVNSTNITPTGTSIVWSIATLDDSSLTNSEFTSVEVLQDINYASLKKLQDKGSGTASLILRADMTTDSDKVSPIIDTAALNVVTINNEINNDITGENQKSGGNALAKYISKPINLADGFDASNICVSVDVNKPIGTNVSVYYKTLPTEKVTPISEETWTLMTPESTVSNSINNLDYKEHRFFPTGAFDSYGTPQDDPISPRFKSFQIKIVLTSTTTTESPKLRDLRIIALDS